MYNTKRCPDCGTELITNRLKDLVCPNCGIIKHHKEEEGKDAPDYCG